MKIKSTMSRGIHLTCSDGQVFSIQFGYGNYCDNYYVRKPEKEYESENCEMAAWNSDGWNTQKVIPECEDDDVVGYISIKRALEIVIEYEKELQRRNNDK